MPASSSPPKGGLVAITSTRSSPVISRIGDDRVLRSSTAGREMPCSSRFITPSR